MYKFADMRGGVVSEEQGRSITSQLFLLLRALHREIIAFRNLNPENVFLDRDWRVRLAYYGLCNFLDRSKLLTCTVCGTLSYVSAGILQEEGTGLSCALGVLGTFLYHMIMGRPPRVAGSLQEAREYAFKSK